MAEKNTAVWLIILTIIACSAVPAVMIWLTTSPKPHLLYGIHEYASNHLLFGNDLLNF